MADPTATVKQRIQRLGVSEDAIRAAWPAWWSDDAAASTSALNDLKFSVARKLGISPPSLFNEGEAVFVWPGEAKFKGLTSETNEERRALTCFGTSVAKLLLSSRKRQTSGVTLKPEWMRMLLFKMGAESISTPEIVSFAQNIGIPVIYLRVFPLEAKRMTAMTVRVGDEFAILLGRDSRYEAPVAFYIAHELGHIALGHLAAETALIDMDIDQSTNDEEETMADRYALALLTGRTSISFDLNRPARNARELAMAVTKASKGEKIDPGVLAMCYGHSHNQWKLAMAALKEMYGDGSPVWESVNNQALLALDLERLTADNHDFLSAVMGFRHE